MRLGPALAGGGLIVALAVAPAVFAPALYDDFTLAKQAALLLAAGLTLAGLAAGGNLLPRDRLVRLCLLGWLGALVLALAGGIDPRGSLLGTYQYRQGFLTQTAYAVLFLGAVQLAPGGRLPRWAHAAGIAGLAAAVLYTAVQALGADPVHWWIDTGARAIGTIGNANELASYAVIGLAFGGGVAGLRGHRGWAGLTALVAAVTFVVFASESRSGLAALAVTLALILALSAAARLPRRAVAWRTAAIAAGAALGALLSMVTGSLQGAAERVQAAPATADASNSTRFELWRGTAAVIRESPVTGFGPDGLYLAFPRYRPVLHGAFDDYDLVAQSSHNILLDTAANYGLLGVVALGALVAVASGAGLRSLRRSSDPATPFVLAALAGYGALTLVNPVSLAPQAIAFVLLGTLAARREPRTAAVERTLPARLRVGLAAPAATLLVGVAILLPVADYTANRGWEAFARGDFREGARLYGRAAAITPSERSYRSDEARAWLAAGTRGDDDAVRRARATLAEFDRDFGLAAGEAIDLATALIGLDAPPEQVEAVVARALRLNPHGVAMAEYTRTLREAAAAGGILVYSPRDHWVYVVPLAAARGGPLR